MNISGKPSARFSCITNHISYLHHVMLHLLAISTGAVCVVLLLRYTRGLAASTMRQATTAQCVDSEMQAVEEEGGGEPEELVLNRVQHIQAREGRDEMNYIEPAQENDQEAMHLLVI